MDVHTHADTCTCTDMMRMHMHGHDTDDDDADEHGHTSHTGHTMYEHAHDRHGQCTPRTTPPQS